MSNLAIFIVGLASFATFGVSYFNQPEQTFGLAAFKSIQVGASPTNGDCLQTDGTDSTWSVCPAGSGGSGGGTWATTTSTVSGQLINYPLNATDIVTIGSNATTSAEFWFDPNSTGLAFFRSASSTFTGNVNVSGALSLGTALTVANGGTGRSSFTASQLLYGAGGGLGIEQVASSSLTISSPLTTSGTPGALVGGTNLTVGLDTTGTWSGNAGTASALAANGANCGAGYFPLGVTAAGAVENCTYAFGTTTPWSAGLLAISQGTGLGYAIASSTLFGYTPLNPTRQLTIAGTANQITSSAGSQDLSADRTWTLSFPSHIIQNSALFTLATTTNATSTNQAITNLLTFNGVTSSTWAGFCATITGSAALCDGDDASGAGGSSAYEIATTTDIAVSQLAYINKVGGRTTLASVATSTTGTASTILALNAIGLTTIPYASTTAATFSQSITIPQNLTLTANGQLTTDDTTGQFRYYAASAQKVVSGYSNRVAGYATSTWTGTTTQYIAPAPAAITVVSAQCETSAGTVGVSLYDGTNRANFFTASTTIGTYTFATNNTFTAGESMRVDFGTPASSPLQVGCTFRYTYTAD